MSQSAQAHHRRLLYHSLRLGAPAQAWSPASPVWASGKDGRESAKKMGPPRTPRLLPGVSRFPGQPAAETESHV